MGGDTLMAGIVIAGFGFRASAVLDSLTSALEKAADGRAVTGFAAPADKINHPALTALARRCDLPLYAVDIKIMKVTDTATRSAIVLEKRQTGSVAEAAALGLFTSPAELICIRQISADGRAVCALAIGESL
tara:strand:- start:142 stop:537 length:396 start_codon:yes stop_codon:yes gene_type:complete